MLRRLTVWLDTSTLKELARMGKERDRPIGYLVRKIVEEYVAQRDKGKSPS